MNRVGETQQTSIHFKELEIGRIRVYLGYFLFFLTLKFNIPLGPLSTRRCKKSITVDIAQKKEILRSKTSASQDDPGNCHNHPDHHHLSDWMVVEVMHLPSDRHSRFLASLLIERTSGRQKAKCICDNFKTYFSAQKIFDIVKCHICCIFLES